MGLVNILFDIAGLAFANTLQMSAKRVFSLFAQCS